MRTIVVVTGVLVVAMMLFARTFLSSYSSAFGQILLVGVVAVFAIALRWMKKLSTPPAQPRVLVDPAEGGVVTGLQMADPGRPGRRLRARGRRRVRCARRSRR